MVDMKMYRITIPPKVNDESTENIFALYFDRMGSYDLVKLNRKQLNSFWFQKAEHYFPCKTSCLV